MESKSIKQQIKDCYQQLSPVCQKVARFVIDNYQQTMLLGSVELAEAANVSHTAVIRFAKALGFSGFLEYKNQLKKEYITTQKVYTSLKSMQMGSKGGYLEEYFSSVKRDMDKFISEFDKSVLDTFCRAILNADTVYVAGIGSDEVVTDFLTNYLNVMGIRTIPVYQEGLTLRERLFLITEKDVLFLSAFPTTMEDEHWAASYARRRGAKVLVLTDSEVTAKSLHADSFALVREYSDVFFNSYVLPMLFCNGLILHLYELEQDRTSASMKAYHEMLSDE
ncbi:MAG: MurR/RpiR family transcriptional regulator [Anaerovoracaceae bacterium]